MAQERFGLNYDNDGDLDMLIGRLGSGGEKIYNNDGAGNFTQTAGLITIISDSTLDIMVWCPPRTTVRTARSARRSSS